MSTTYVELESLTLEQIQAKMREIAAARPDFVYIVAPEENCSYVREGDDGKLRGDCLVGCALVDLGVDPERLVPVMPAEQLLYYSEGDWHVRRWIQWTQENQDQGQAWLAAAQQADRTYARMFGN